MPENTVGERIKQLRDNQNITIQELAERSGVNQELISKIYGQDTYTLQAGDSIYYDSIVPHHLHAAGEEKARILAVVYTPF